MRLFVAVEIGAAIAAGARALIADLRRHAERLAPRARISWVDPDRAHLTVRFIGEVDEVKAHAIEEVLRQQIDIAPFELTVAGLSAFPPRGRPRVLWVGLTMGLDAMMQLERQITLRLQQAHVPADEKPYRPHLTLARIRDAGGLRSPALCDTWSDVVLGTTRVEASTLFESRLSSTGPEYVALQRTPLRS